MASALNGEQIREMWEAGYTSLLAEQSDALGLGSGKYSELQGVGELAYHVAGDEGGNIYVGTDTALTVLNEFGTAVIDVYDATQNNSDDDGAARASISFDKGLSVAAGGLLGFGTTSEFWLKRPSVTLHEHLYDGEQHLNPKAPLEDFKPAALPWRFSL